MLWMKTRTYEWKKFQISVTDANFENGQRNFESAHLNSNEIIIYEILGIQFPIELIIKITFKF